MQIKSILIASTALFTAGAAHSADLPQVAEPLKYVQSCDAFGNGYFNLPGTETCLSIGGRIRAQVRTGNLTDDGSDWDSYTRGYFHFETETPTGFGSIYTYTGAFYTWNQEDDEASWSSDDAWITFKTDYADLNFGVKLSEFYGFLGYSWMQIGGANWPEYYPLQASINVPLQDLTLSLAVEDASYMDGADGGVNVVGALDYSQDLFNMRAAGVVTENVNKEYGYAVSLKTEFTPVDNLALTIAGMYGVDASRFVGLSGSAYGDILTGSEDDESSTYFDSLGVEAFSVMGGIKYGVSEKVDVMAEASYLQFETDSDTVNFDGEALRVSGSVVFKPVSGLGIAFAAGYSELTANGEGANTQDTVTENFRVGTRIQYSF